MATRPTRRAPWSPSSGPAALGSRRIGAAALVLLARLLLSRAAIRGTELPYRRVDSVLTPAERSFYGVLRQAIDGHFTIFAKVRLADLLDLPSGSLNRRTYLNKIDRKHVDFVLCAPEDLAPLLAIELDDATHKGFFQQQSDRFKDEALEAAGLPILRVPAKHSYPSAELRTLIEKRLQRDRGTGRWSVELGQEVEM